MMSQQPVKLQINSLDALNRLIGGDSELELQLRQQVVAEFAKKYLKSIVLDEWFQKWMESLKADLQKTFQTMVKEAIGEVYFSSYGPETVRVNKLGPALQTKIREEAIKVAQKIIMKASLSEEQMMDIALKVAEEKVRKEFMQTLKAKKA
jgi:hypothetical protein